MEHGLKDVVCECDSREAVHLITGFHGDFHHFRGLLHEINSLPNRNWGVQVQHILREANQCADDLAKHGAGVDSSFNMLRSPRTTVSNALLVDSSKFDS